MAQVTNRPLLVRGSSGNGKSSLARNVAQRLEAAWDDPEATRANRTAGIVAVEVEVPGAGLP